MGKTKTKNKPKNSSIIITMWKKYYTPLVAGLIIGLLLGLSMFYFGTYKTGDASPKITVAENKKLLFAGGGSVVTYLNYNYSDTVIKHFPEIFERLNNSYSKDSIFSMNYYPNSIYLHMPSGPALSLLVEEALMPDTRERQPFYPVCFSAMEADDSIFTKTCTKEQIKDVGIILQYYIGDEHLRVYLEENDSLEKNTKLKSIIKNRTTITVDNLRYLLENKYYTVYSTSPESGTFRAYVDAIGDKKRYNLDSTESYSCESDSVLFKKTKKPFMILGGQFYYPKKFKDHIDNDKIHSLTLVDNDENGILNPLYLYFMAYKDKDKYIVTKEIMDLLEILDLKDTDRKHRLRKDPNDDLYIVYIDKDEFEEIILPINKKEKE